MKPLSRISGAFVLLCVSFLTQAQITSTFDTGADGWTTLDGNAGDPVYVTTGGNPGGFLRASDGVGGVQTKMVAPAKFLGNRIFSYGQFLRFDLKTALPSTASNNDIIIFGGGTSLVRNVIPPQPNTTTWTTYSQRLHEDQTWFIGNTSGPVATKAQVIQVLISVTAIHIGVEYSLTFGPTDIGMIDNVILEEIPPPTVTNFSPISGPVGTTVIITGTNFSTTLASNIVFFGATQAVVTAATNTQLTVTVPAGATYEPISVSVNGLTAHAPRAFVVTFAGGGNIDACSFGPPINLGTNTGPVIHPSLVDVDGDGKPDLITTDFNNDIVSIRRNISIPGIISTGSFETSVDLTTGDSPMGAVFGDLDSDGRPDLAVVNYLGGQLSVFKNLSTPGAIAFAPKVDFPVPTFVADAQIADIDRDGKQDLIITNFGASALLVLRNTSTPGVINASSFAAAVNFNTGPNPYPFSLGDIDGDGKLDAAVPNGNQHSVSVLRNTSTPGTVSFETQLVLTTAPGTPVAGQGAFYSSLGDLDGDNKLDLVVTNNTTFIISIFRNISAPGSLSFDPKVDLSSTNGSDRTRISDLDGDEKVDLAIDEGFSAFTIYKNAGTPGTITFNLPIAFPKTSNSYQLLAGDIDGDGRNDIISCSDNVLVFRNLTGTILLPTITSFTPTVGPVGTTVTISGNNFSTPFSNAVEFNGTAATISGSTATTLTVTVPAGATTGPIQITIGCNTITSSNFTVGFPPITITAQPSDFITCEGNIASFTTAATGTTNITYQWQFSTTLTGTYNDIANGGGYSNVQTSSLSVNTNGNFGAGFYRCKIDGDLALTVFSNAVELTVNIVPIVPTIGTTNLGCAPVSTTLTPTGASAGEQYKFFDVATGGSPLSSGLSFTTPSLTASTTYHISTYNSTTLCESARVPAVVNVQSCNPPVMETSTTTAFIEGVVTIDLEPLISDEDNNLDPSTLQIISQPVSGASASLNDFILTIDYTSVPVHGSDNLEIEICDLTGICTQQILVIELEGEIEVFNAISPNNDSHNDVFIIQHIHVLPETQKNKVTIFNRWGDVVFDITNYNNNDRVFIGLNNNGKELPSGTYFYKIEFSGRESKTGYLSLKR